jgi:hypothetical protein
MIQPSPELLRRYRNVDEVVKSGRSYLIPDFVAKYPSDYMDLVTYESIKRAMQFP